MKTINLLFSCLLFVGLNAQDHGDPQMSKHMRSLELLVGHWEGEGYMIDQSRVKHEFTQVEDITFDLDSTIIYIKGVGTSEGKIVHDARAIISPTDTAESFEFYSFLSDGRKGKFMMEKENNIIRWYIEADNGTIRYTITLSENNYHEIGEFGYGDQWYPFLEMNLVKIDS